MTGLERLQELVDDMDEWSVFAVMKRDWRERHGVTVIDGRMAMKDLLSEIVDQIERETAHDPSKDVSMSAYDLLPEEDRKAIAWVREKGGVNALSMGFQDADNRRIELCSSLGIDLETGWADAMVAMRRRLMPEGMEWPRFEPGEPVHIGDEFMGKDGKTYTVQQVQFIGKCFSLYDFCDRKAQFNAFYGERVKRPAPKVLDADGVEIHVGDTVCGTRDMEPMRVVDTDSRECGFKRIKCEKEGDGFFFYCADELTHKLPVLAADGRPLREGEHVYHVETGAELVVKELPKPGEYQAVVVFAPPASHLTSFDPDQLTHEQPDSWERLEEDAGKEACEYFAHMPCGCETSEMLDETVEKCNAAKARDLVRRAKKLAGVER